MKHFNKKMKGKKHKFTFTCDICFTQNVLDRHMKNIHGDFSQIEKGIKRTDKNNFSPDFLFGTTQADLSNTIVVSYYKTCLRSTLL